MLTVSVKNLGPLAEGTVELRPLTIFVGPSNTGKSYMATAVHAAATAYPGLHPRSFSTYSRRAMRRFTSSLHSVENEELVQIAESLKDWVGQQGGEEANPPELTVATLPASVRSWLNKVTLKELSLFQDRVIDRMRQIHEGNSGLVNRKSEPEGFSLGLHQENPLLNLEMKLTDNSKFLPQFDLSQVPVPPEILKMSLSLPGSNEYDFYEIAADLADSAAKSLFSELPAQSYYLPAARSGIAHGHKVLASALVAQSTSVGIRQMNIPTLPGITTEFLSSLISLDRRMGRGRSAPALERAIAFIESNVLHGGIAFDESAGLPHPEIVYAPAGIEQPPGKFTLDHTSSMVSELAPVILFLKYLVNPGDLLILEEPESHLHPAAQLRMARGIARLVNAGVQVLITTHSDIFVSQINNLLALGQASPELAAERGFEAEDFLQENQVGAYLFRDIQKSGGSVIAPLEIDPDTGIDESDFSDVFEAIYDESIALQRDRD